MNYLNYPAYHIYNLLVLLLSTLHMLRFFYLSQYLMNRCSCLFSSGASPGVWLIWQVLDMGLVLEDGWCDRSWVWGSPWRMVYDVAGVTYYWGDILLFLPWWNANSHSVSGGISYLFCHVWILSVWACAQSPWAPLCVCPIVSRKAWFSESIHFPPHPHDSYHLSVASSV